MPASGGFWDDVVPRVDADLCQRCEECPAIAACLAQGIRREAPDSVPHVDEQVCFGCYSCAGACRHGAIILPRSR